MASIANREFRVHAGHLDSYHAHLVTEASFEAAAVAFLERFPHAPDNDHEVSVVVREVSSGHQHCFRINLETGETAICG